MNSQTKQAWVITEIMSAVWRINLILAHNHSLLERDLFVKNYTKVLYTAYRRDVLSFLCKVKLDLSWWEKQMGWIIFSLIIMFQHSYYNLNWGHSAAFWEHNLVCDLLHVCMSWAKQVRWTPRVWQCHQYTNYRIRGRMKLYGTPGWISQGILLLELNVLWYISLIHWSVMLWHA